MSEQNLKLGELIDMLTAIEIEFGAKTPVQFGRYTKDNEWYDDWCDATLSFLDMVVDKDAYTTEVIVKLKED